MYETDLAATVIHYLKDLKYDVYQEVGPDIVAVMNGRAWIIECKLTLGLGVLAQAWKWAQHRSAAYVSVATPVFRRDDSRAVAEWFLRYHGIGWLIVSGTTFANYRSEYPVREAIPARVLRPDAAARRYYDIRKFCTEKNRDYEQAGSPAPRSWTPFKQLGEDVRDLLRRKGPLTIREIVENVEHHYASDAGARSRLAHYLSHGIIKGIAAHENGRPQRWALEGTAAQEEKER